MSVPKGMPKAINPLLLLMMVAVPAVLPSKRPRPTGNPKDPAALLFVIIALAAELLPKNSVLPPVNALVMFAFIAELESLNTVVPPNWFTMVALPAVVALKNFVTAGPPSLVIEVMPAVLALTTLKA